MQDVFAGLLDGAVLDGPEWAVSPTETDRPQHAADVTTGGEGADEGDIQFGEPAPEASGQTDEAERGSE
jgi:hypothetical protein